jgi:predicted dehydrogenase
MSVRIAVIGPGIFWNKAHRPALTKRNDVEVVAFCASSERRKAETADAFPGRPFYTGRDAFLSEVDCDAVLVTTPLFLNAATARRALERGRNVVVEKPLATSSADAFALEALAREKGLQLLVAEHHPYRPVTAAVQRCLTEGKIGRPVMFDSAAHYQVAGPYRSGWRKDGEWPLGLLFDGGIHNVSDHSTFFGACRGVFASGIGLREGFGEYDEVLMQFEFASGVRGMFSHSGMLGRQCNYFHIRGTEGVIRIDGDVATLLPDDGEEETIDCGGTVAHDLMWDHFLARLRDGAEPLYPAARAAADVATLEAVCESCHTGKWVEPRAGG